MEAEDVEVKEEEDLEIDVLLVLVADVVGLLEEAREVEETAVVLWDEVAVKDSEVEDELGTVDVVDFMLAVELAEVEVTEALLADVEVEIKVVEVELGLDGLVEVVLTDDELAVVELTEVVLVEVGLEKTELVV